MIGSSLSRIDGFPCTAVRLLFSVLQIEVGVYISVKAAAIFRIGRVVWMQPLLPFHFLILFVKLRKNFLGMFYNSVNIDIVYIYDLLQIERNRLIVGEPFNHLFAPLDVRLTTLHISYVILLEDMVN